MVSVRTSLQGVEEETALWRPSRGPSDTAMSLGALEVPKPAEVEEGLS